MKESVNNIKMYSLTIYPAYKYLSCQFIDDQTDDRWNIFSNGMNKRNVFRQDAMHDIHGTTLKWRTFRQDDEKHDAQ